MHQNRWCSKFRQDSATSAYTVPMKLLGFNLLVNAPVMEIVSQIANSHEDMKHIAYWHSVLKR